MLKVDDLSASRYSEEVACRECSSIHLINFRQQPCAKEITQINGSGLETSKTKLRCFKLKSKLDLPLESFKETNNFNPCV